MGRSLEEEPGHHRFLHPTPGDGDGDGDGRLRQNPKQKSPSFLETFLYVDFMSQLRWQKQKTVNS